MKKLITLAVIVIVISLQSAKAQEVPKYWSINYGVSFGSGDLGDYISKTSYRGFVFEYRKPVPGYDILLGFDIGWNVFTEKKGNATYTIGTESVSGIQYRNQNQVPILISGDYFFITSNPLKAYAGFGIGAMYTERVTDMGQWRVEEKPWHFVIKPEVGALYELSSYTSVKFAFKYYNGFQAGDLEEAQSFYSLSLGLAFHL